MAMRSIKPAWHWLVTLVMVMGLSACALPRMIDSEVQSFVGSPMAIQGASYRFERLPSQQSRGNDQYLIEALAQEALERAGLLRNDAQARYSVQVDVGIQTYTRTPHRPRHFPGPVMASDGSLWYPAPMLVLEPPWYSHTVHLLFRDLGTAQVAFESTAHFDGPWADSVNLLPAILDAALHDYPNPPQGPRKVVIELPPKVRDAR
jgi:hypothetical protein